MRAVILYESMFGNTRRIAEAIGRGLAPLGDVAVVHVADADIAHVADADLLVLGAPTHALGLPRPNTRRSAAEMAAKPGNGVILEAQASGAGMREWLPDLRPGKGAAAVFDTRLGFPMAGHASKKLRRHLRHHGYSLVTPPESFTVDNRNVLRPGEEERAVAWGRHLSSVMSVPTGALTW